MNQDIINAIDTIQKLSFNYDGYHRVVEPHTYGINTANNEVLTAYQVEGGHVSPKNEPWGTFKLSKIQNLQCTGQPFDGPRPGYKRNDKGMQKIFAQL